MAKICSRKAQGAVAVDLLLARTRDRTPEPRWSGQVRSPPEDGSTRRGHPIQRLSIERDNHDPHCMVHRLPRWIGLRRTTRSEARFDPRVHSVSADIAVLHMLVSLLDCCRNHLPLCALRPGRCPTNLNFLTRNRHGCWIFAGRGSSSVLGSPRVCAVVK